MKIAMPTRGGEIDAHFGHCEYFTVFTVDGGVVVAEERVDSPAGCGCKSNVASILAGKGVSLMVAGNMGDGAVRVLKRQGVEVIRGCAGSVR
ncbi:MAG TPA: NifB/NifX family molybdenum-iron cluster-binding protein, partial [Treponemataceae bacterium]|nr:NifB/NifX family molybdenum-iron cluster-binding protein [Treponemataceae bacterium]